MAPSVRVYPSFSLFIALKNKACIVTTKTHGIGHSDINRALSRLVWHVVEITVGIRVAQIDGGRYSPCRNGHYRDHRLDTPGRSQRVPCHRLGRTDCHAIGMLAKTRLDGLRLCPIIERSRSAVG